MKQLLAIMNELIEKIDVCEPAVKQALQWLSESGNNGLHEGNMNDIIRFLLKRVFELEAKIESNGN